MKLGNFILVFLISLFLISSVSAWWNDDWSKRKEIQITEQSGETQTNYPVRLNIPYDENMNEDYSDLRFLDSTDTIELKYYIWQKTPEYALVDVKIPELVSGQTTTIHMYYGNPNVDTTSNGINTYLWFEDFESTSVGAIPADWFGYQGNNELGSVEATEAHEGLKHFIFDDYTSSYGNGFGKDMPTTYEKAKYMFYSKKISGLNNQKFVLWNNASHTTYAGSYCIFSEFNPSQDYKWIEVQWNENNQWRFVYEDGTITNWQNFICSGDGGAFMFYSNTPEYSNYYYDQLALSKFIFPEPTYLIQNNEPLFIMKNQLYNPKTVSKNIDTFNIELSYDPSYYINVIGKLIYGGTEYLGEQETINGKTIFSKTLQIPNVNETQEIEFYWIFDAYFNESNYEQYSSQTNTQEVNPSPFVCGDADESGFVNISDVV